MRRPRIGLALGSGAARGWAHIGVLRALEDAGHPPDIVCGSSIGALVGAAYVAGELDALERWARDMTWAQIVGFLDFTFSGGGLIEGRRLMRFLSSLRGDAPMETFAKRFAAVATDLASGREIWLDKGSALRAVRASIALPGLLSPVRIDGRWLVDGGLVNPVPVSVCRAMGADIIIAVNLNGGLVGRGMSSRLAARRAVSKGPPLDLLGRLMPRVPFAEPPTADSVAAHLLEGPDNEPGYFDVVFGAINIMQDYLTRSRLAGEPPDVLVMPRLADIAILEFNRAEETIAEGRRSVRRMLPALGDALAAAAALRLP